MTTCSPAPTPFVSSAWSPSITSTATGRGSAVPAVAIQRGPQGTFVYVAGAAGTAEPRSVTVDAIEGDQALVAKGLAPGEPVVIEGQNQLRPGAKIVARGAPGSNGTARP